jgi:hypothetical protein
MKRSPTEIQTATQWKLMGRQNTLTALPYRLCYRPAVFFYDLRLTALSLPQKKIGASNKCYYAVLFLLGGSAASETYVPTFRNNLFLLCGWCNEDGTNSVPKCRHIKFSRQESPKRKNKAFRTRRKFEIKKCYHFLYFLLITAQV